MARGRFRYWLPKGLAGSTDRLVTRRRRELVLSQTKGSTERSDPRFIASTFESNIGPRHSLN